MHGPKRQSRRTRGLARDVDQFTKDGTSALQAEELNKAVESFELAFKRAQQLGDGFAQRACAFNLGAVYIAVKQPKKGVEILQHAIPPQNKHDGKSNGDLFYNFALGYEALANPLEACRYFELALEEYQMEKQNSKMEAEVAITMGNLYIELREWLPAARAFGLASRSFGLMSDWENQAVSLCREATSLFQGQRPDLALQVADDCMILCQRVHQVDPLGQLYNELGLTYTQCRDFGKAAACFELALPLSRCPKADRKYEAVILQNLGAVYNSLGDYQRAIGFHEAAAKLHAEFGNRNSQGQCFNNLAFAYSQVGDTEAAGEAYLHALQAARDIGDKHGQWQAMEGLGAVAFNDNQFSRAVRYFKMALAVLSTSEQNALAQERIVQKLSDSIQFMTADSEDTETDEDSIHKGRYSGKVDILVNDEPRPPTRQEQRQMKELRELRKQRRAYGKRQSPFIPIALGVSEYESDSDRSVGRHHHSRPRSRKSNRKLDRAASESGTRQRNSRYTASETDSALKRKMDTRKVQSDEEGLTRRSNSEPYDYLDSRGKLTSKRRHVRPLLRPDSFDSDEERRQIMNQDRGPMHSGQPRAQKRTEPESSHANVSKAMRKLNLSRNTEMIEMGHKETRLNASSDMRTNGQSGRFNQTNSTTDTESDTESDTEDDITDTMKTTLPPAPPAPASLGSTYVEPLVVEAGQVLHAESEPQLKLTGPNYFREEDIEEDMENRKIGNFKEIVKKPVDDKYDIDDDPIYQTIRSAKSSLPQPLEEPKPGTSAEQNEFDPPPLPPRPTFEAMTRAEKEAFLFDYQQKRDNNIRQHEQRQTNDDEVDLPQKAKRASRACVVM